MEDPAGRRVLWGWIKGFKEKRGWNGCLTLPRILTLHADGRLLQTPAPALQKLRGQLYDLAETPLRNTTNFLQSPKGDTLEIVAEIKPINAKSFGLQLRCSDDGARCVLVSFDGDELNVAGTKARLPPREKGQSVKLHLFLDKSVLEVYADGHACFSRVIYPKENDLGVSLFACGGEVQILALHAWPLKTIWER
jgi:beta-fructofuranosidase